MCKWWMGLVVAGLVFLIGGCSSAGQISPPRVWSYTDQSVKLVDISYSHFKGYLLEIGDPTRVKVGVAQNIGAGGQTTSEIAKENGAVAAVNAGGFQNSNTRTLPAGVIIHNGQFVAGENLKGSISLVGLTTKGALLMGSYTVQQMKTMGVTEGISFSSSLIVDSKKQITSGDGGWGVGPSCCW